MSETSSAPTLGSGIAALRAHWGWIVAFGVLLVICGVIGLLTVVLAWLSSQLSPAWASRYLAVGVAPLLLVASAGLARAGKLGIAGLIVAAVVMLVLPHVIGAPEPPTHETAVPAPLLREFVVGVLVTSFLFWLVLGSLTGFFYKRFAAA